MSSGVPMIYHVWIEDSRATAACTVLIHDMGREYRIAEFSLHRSDFPSARLSRYQHFPTTERDKHFIERKMRATFGAKAKVEITPVPRAGDVEAKVEAAADYLSASGFTDVQEITQGGVDVRTIRMNYSGAVRELKLGLLWLGGVTPAEVYALLTQKDVAVMLRGGEGGIEIRDSSTLEHYRAR